MPSRFWDDCETSERGQSLCGCILTGNGSPGHHPETATVSALSSLSRGWRVLTSVILVLCPSRYSTPDLGPPLSAIHFATRRQCDLAGYLPEGGDGKFGFAIDLLILKSAPLESLPSRLTSPMLTIVAKQRNTVDRCQGREPAGGHGTAPRFANFTWARTSRPNYTPSGTLRVSYYSR